MVGPFSMKTIDKRYSLFFVLFLVGVWETSICFGLEIEEDFHEQFIEKLKKDARDPFAHENFLIEKLFVMFEDGDNLTKSALIFFKKHYDEVKEKISSRCIDINNIHEYLTKEPFPFMNSNEDFINSSWYFMASLPSTKYLKSNPDVEKLWKNNQNFIKMIGTIQEDRKAYYKRRGATHISTPGLLLYSDLSLTISVERCPAGKYKLVFNYGKTRMSHEGGFGIDPAINKVIMYTFLRDHCVSIPQIPFFKKVFDENFPIAKGNIPFYLKKEVEREKAKQFLFTKNFLIALSKHLSFKDLVSLMRVNRAMNINIMENPLLWASRLTLLIKRPIQVNYFISQDNFYSMCKFLEKNIANIVPIELMISVYSLEETIEEREDRFDRIRIQKQKTQDYQRQKKAFFDEVKTDNSIRSISKEAVKDLTKKIIIHAKKHHVKPNGTIFLDSCGYTNCPFNF